MGARIVLLVSFWLALIRLSQAQVGIGITNPHPSSIMELNSSTKGLLIPRLSLLQILSILTPPQGLLVYNTTLQEFQFYDGLLWQPLIPIGIGDNWGIQTALTSGVLQGNGISGTEIRLRPPLSPTAGQTILWDGSRWSHGFTNQPGPWLRNGTGANRKLYTNYVTDSIGIGTTIPDAKFTVKGIVNTDSAFFINGIHGISFRKGNRNLALGNNAGKGLNLSSSDNILIGEDAGPNIKGNNNIGIYNCLYANTTISNNIAIGFYAGSSTKSNNNILIGYYAGFNMDNSFGKNILLTRMSIDFNGQNTVGLGYGEYKTSNNSVFITSSMTHTHHNSVMIGTGFLDANSNQTDNVVLGQYTLGHGSYNVVAGYYCGPNKIVSTKNYCVLLGSYAGGYTRALNQGICIGTDAGRADSLGTKNNFIGFGAGKSPSLPSLSDCFGIGYNAIVNQTKSMVLGGTGADAVNVGINVTAPTDRLQLTGNFLLNGALMPNGNPGAVNQMLMSQGTSLPPVWTPAGDNLGNHTLTQNLSTQSYFLSNTGANNGIFLSATNRVGINHSSPTDTLSVTGTVYATNITGPNYLYTTNKTANFSIPFANPKTYHTTLRINQASNYAYIANGIIGSTGEFYYPINLPHGSTITTLNFRYMDNSVLYNIGFELIRTQAPDAAPSPTNQVIANWTSSGTSTTIQNVAHATFTDPVIDNENYYYFLKIKTYQADATLRFYGAFFVVTKPAID